MQDQALLEERGPYSLILTSVRSVEVQPLATNGLGYRIYEQTSLLFHESFVMETGGLIHIYALVRQQINYAYLPNPRYIITRNLQPNLKQFPREISVPGGH